jgi:hypothetical protein
MMLGSWAHTGSQEKEWSRVVMMGPTESIACSPVSFFFGDAIAWPLPDWRTHGYHQRQCSRWCGLKNTKVFMGLGDGLDWVSPSFSEDPRKVLDQVGIALRLLGTIAHVGQAHPRYPCLQPGTESMGFLEFFFQSLSQKNKK